MENRGTKKRVAFIALISGDTPEEELVIAEDELDQVVAKAMRLQYWKLSAVVVE